MPRSRFSLGRLVLGGLVLATVGILLVACTLVSPREQLGVPGTAGTGSRSTTAPSPRGTVAPSKVLLDASFNDGELDEDVFNTCHWWAMDGCTIASNDELEWYVPGQVDVADGALRLTADRNPVRGSDGRPYDFRSGMVTTGPPPGDEDAPAKLAFTYGSVEARLRIPAGQGLWPALWLLPADRESLPEIDVLEAVGQNPDEVLMKLHPENPRARAPSERYRVPGPDLAEDWHTLRLDWTAGKLEFFVDDVRVWRVTGDRVPEEPMYVVLNLAVGGVYPGPPDATTPFPATFAIDHLRITGA